MHVGDVPVYCWRNEEGQEWYWETLRETGENVKDRSGRERQFEKRGHRATEKAGWGERKKEEKKDGGRVSRRDRYPLIAWREHDNWEESKGRKISSSIDQSGSSISVASSPLLRLPLHPICTRNLDWSVFVFVCACICVYVEVILHSVRPSLCAYISFVFIYLLMCLSITCQCRGTWGVARNSAVNRVDTNCVCDCICVCLWEFFICTGSEISLCDELC